MTARLFIVLSGAAVETRVFSAALSCEKLLDFFAISLETDDRLPINHDSRWGAAVPSVHELVHSCCIGAYVLRIKRNTFVPKKLFGCMAIGSTSSFEKSYVFHFVALDGSRSCLAVPRIC
jgi:hypothetical protein